MNVSLVIPFALAGKRHSLSSSPSRTAEAAVDTTASLLEEDKKTLVQRDELHEFH
jgi:hypothetical protein